MIRILVALKEILEITYVKTILGALNAGQSVADLLKTIASKFSKDSLNYQMISSLDEALKVACEELGWEYDALAVSQEFDLKNAEYTLMTVDGLTKLLGLFTGMKISKREAEVFINCFDRAVAEKEKLSRFLIQKWIRYTVDEKLKNASQYEKSIPFAITRIPMDVSLIGREANIDYIRKQICQHEIISIKADGGVGKTVLALRIVNDIKREIYNGASCFKHVAWITSSGNLRNDLTKLDIPIIEDRKNLEDKQLEIYAFFQNNPVFMVIDNMELPLIAEERSILNTISGLTRILITTRIEMESIFTYTLPEIDNASAEQLFYKHYTNNDIPLKEIRERNDYVIAQGIISKICNNALLIELIGKMAFVKNMELCELISLLKENGFSIDSAVSLHTAHAESHGYSFEQNEDLTMQNQISKLYQMSGLSSDQMDILAFVALFPSSSKVFAKSLKWCGFSVNDLQWLLKCGWIKIEDDCYSMHSIVKASIEFQNEKRGYRVDFNKYKQMIDNLSNTRLYLPSNIEYSRYKERADVPKWICNMLENEQILDDETIQLILPLELSLSEIVCKKEGDYKKALDYCFKALGYCKLIYGEKSLETAGVYYRIAIILFDDFDYKNALYYLNKDYMLSKKLNECGLGMAYTYNLLGEVYGKLGKNNVAKYYFLKALSVLSIKSKEIVEEDIYRTKADVYDNLANMYSDRGKYEEALLYHYKALTIYENMPEKDDSELATSYNNIALTHYYLGKLSEAQYFYEKSLSIRTKVLGDNHPFLIGTYCGLMEVYYLQGNDEALQKLKQELYEKYNLKI